MMFFLSQVWIGKDEAARYRLYDCYAWHQAVWQAFPNMDKQPRSFLFRVDDKQDRFRVLLLSQTCPTAPKWGTWQTKEISPAFLSHDYYLFQLRANPTIKKTVFLEEDQKKKNGRRIGIYDESALQSWLSRKASSSGMELLEISVGSNTAQYFTRNGKRGKHDAVDFQGLLRVADRDAFAQAFFHGIGSAKTFGFGLLMLEPCTKTQDALRHLAQIEKK